MKVYHTLIVFVILWGISTHQLFASPVIHNIVVDNGDAIEHGSILTVQGSNFGEKKNAIRQDFDQNDDYIQASPVLFDHVDHAYENGLLKDLHNNLEHMSAVPQARFDGDANALYNGAPSCFIDFDSENRRHRHSGASYFAEGSDAQLRSPMAYGGESADSMPIDNPQLYVSFFYKPRYNGSYLWRFAPVGQIGEFVEGEDVIIDGVTYGPYIRYDGVQHHTVIEGHRNANNLKGKTITGVTSAATTVFPSHSNETTGYTSPKSKYMRVRDDIAGNGIQVAIEHSHIITDCDPEGVEAQPRVLWEFMNIEGERWHHFEYELDINAGVWRFWFYSHLHAEGSFDLGCMYSGAYSPTPTMIGPNGYLTSQKSWLSDIYMDNTLQRVVVANASTYENVTHHELQFPISWSDEKIKIILNEGALKLTEDAYLYIFDKNGIPNKYGFPLKKDNLLLLPPKNVYIKSSLR